MYNAGEKPGKGTYHCLKCGRKIKIKEDEALPPCPNCKNKVYRK